MKRKTKKDPRPKVSVDLDNDGKPDIDISLIDDEAYLELGDPEPDQELEPEPELEPKPGGLDALIASLYEKPETHRFIAPTITGYKLAVGTRTIAFVKSPTSKVGELITDDPWVIEQLLRNRDCNLKYYPESAKLRNY